MKGPSRPRKGARPLGFLALAIERTQVRQGQAALDGKSPSVDGARLDQAFTQKYLGIAALRKMRALLEVFQRAKETTIKQRPAGAPNKNPCAVSLHIAEFVFTYPAANAQIEA